VRSRCQRIVLGQPDRQQALDWLLTQDPQQPLSLDDWDQLLAQCGGAPVAALQARQHEAARNGFVRLLRDGRPEVLAAADATQGLPPALLVGWLQRWVYDLLRARLGTPVRYHLAEAPLLAQLAARCDLIALTRLLRSLGDSLRLAEHPLNARLFAEDLFIRYREVFVVNALAGGPRRSSASSSASR
jgi:DNA polymerase-3 subunit delta'